MKRVRQKREDDDKKKILIVDDQMENIRPFKLAFRKDFKILTAMDAKEALEVMEAEAVDLVVTDQNMPEMTGIELLEIIDAQYPTIAKVLLTGNTDLEYLRSGCRDIHVAKIVLKPYEREELLVLFKKLVSVSPSTPLRTVYYGT